MIIIVNCKPHFEKINENKKVFLFAIILNYDYIDAVQCISFIDSHNQQQ